MLEYLYDLPPEKVMELYTRIFPDAKIEYDYAKDEYTITKAE